MADNVAVTAGSGTTIAADEVSDGTLGTVKVQYVKIMDGTLDGTTKAAVSSAGLKVDLGADNDVTNAVLTAAADGNDKLGVVIHNSSGTAVDPIPAVAHDATDAQAPTKVGGYASDTPPTNVTANGDRVNAWFKRNGAQVNSLYELPPFTYETTAASTDNTLGTGAAGDYLQGVLIIPATTSPGSVQIGDGATDITIFTGGTDSVSNLVPFFVPLGMVSASGAWSVITGANVSAIAVGRFT